MGYYYTVAEYKIPFLSFLSKKIKNINGILNLKNHFLHQSNVKKKFVVRLANCLNIQMVDL